MEIPAALVVAGLLQVFGFVVLLIALRWVTVLAKTVVRTEGSEVKLAIRPGSVTFTALNNGLRSSEAARQIELVGLTEALPGPAQPASGTVSLAPSTPTREVGG